MLAAHCKLAERQDALADSLPCNKYTWSIHLCLVSSILDLHKNRASDKYISAISLNVWCLAGWLSCYTIDLVVELAAGCCLWTAGWKGLMPWVIGSHVANINGPFVLIGSATSQISTEVAPATNIKELTQIRYNHSRILQTSILKYQPRNSEIS